MFFDKTQRPYTPHLLKRLLGIMPHCTPISASTYNIGRNRQMGTPAKNFFIRQYRRNPIDKPGLWCYNVN